MLSPVRNPCHEPMSPPSFPLPLLSFCLSFSFSFAFCIGTESLRRWGSIFRIMCSKNWGVLYIYIVANIYWALPILDSSSRTVARRCGSSFPSNRVMYCTVLRCAPYFVGSMRGCGQMTSEHCGAPDTHFFTPIDPRYYSCIASHYKFTTPFSSSILIDC